MAQRNIILEGDPMLYKKSRVVENFNNNLATLIEDMIETMYAADGAGLAAPQVGILKRIITIDIGDGLIELINPEIIEFDGEQRVEEGCLSIPGYYGVTLRPMHVKVRAQDRFGNEIIQTGSNLKAKALCHEIDHLDGILFKSRLAKK